MAELSPGPNLTGSSSAEEQTRLTHGFLEVEGGRLYFEVDGQGPPVVLIHAGLWDSRIWDDQMPAFAERNTVVRYDLRGYGRSSRLDAPFSARQDLVDLLGFLGLERTALVGASIGGGVALDFALEHPDMVTALVLVAPGVGGDQTPDDERTERLMHQAERAAGEGDLERAVDLELEVWAPLRTDPRVDERIRRIAMENRHELTLDWSLHRRLDPPAAGRLSEVVVPTLVVIGDGDVPAMWAVSAKLVDGIPGTKKALIRGADHLPNMRRPDEFNRVVLEFLDGVPGR